RTISNNVVWSGNGTIGGSNNITINGSFTSSGAATRSITVNTVTVTLGGNVYLAESDIARGLTFAGSGALTIKGVIANNATARTVTFGGTGNTTISGVIANGGGSTSNLGKSGAGTLTLTNANTYTGTTTISGGTLQLGNGSTTGSLSTSSTITDNGNFTINRSDAVIQGTDFSGSAITGTGSLTQAGTGTTTLNA